MPKRAATATGNAARADLSGWYDELARAMAPLDAMGAASLVVDATSGRILGTTGATQRVFAGQRPADLDALVGLGLIAKPDLARLRDWVLDRRRVDRRGGSPNETAHSLTDRLRVHRAGHDPLDVEVSLVYHRRPQHAAEAVTISLRPLEVGETGPEPTPSLPRELWTLHDLQMRVIATDPRLADLAIDPPSQIGMPASTLTHPEDLPRVLDPVNAVVRGQARSAQIRIRAAVADGGWQPGSLELRRLVTDGEPVILGVIRFDRPGRRAIPAGVLTPRQTVVVGALFDGRRVKEIAAAEHVSVRTVRNQLAAAYRKLDVSGQGDLLATYLRPSEA